uniref:Uncharacterized protein n=1 Tax=Triticum urartu TaxID=4572 RepID=A0A8R7TG22_TRIUA
MRQQIGAATLSGRVWHMWCLCCAPGGLACVRVAGYASVFMCVALYRQRKWVVAGRGVLRLELEDIRGSRLYCNIFVHDFLTKSEIIRHLKFNPLEKMRVFMYYALWMLTILIAGAGKVSAVLAVAYRYLGLHQTSVSRT